MRILRRTGLAAMVSQGHLFPAKALALGLVCASINSAFCGRAAASAPAPGAAQDASVITVTSQLGSYMAGRVARSFNDVTAAANYYSNALARDPENEILLEQAFLTQVTEGNWLTATPLAERLVRIQPSHRMAQAYMGLTEFKKTNFSEADSRLKAAAVNPIGELTSLLARAWVKQAAGKTQEALDLLDTPKQPEWAQVFLRYHKALLADSVGRTAEARSIYERIYRTDQKTLRIALAYAQHAARAGDFKLAQQVLQQHLDRSKGEGHPMARALSAQIEAGERAVLLVATPTEGLAEVFYGLGEALTGEGGVGPGAVFIQMALYMQPTFPFALATLANVYESTKNYDAAIVAYDRIPRGTPLETSIAIRKALNLNQLERVDEAKSVLDALVQEDPKDLKPLDALGTMMRGHKRFDEAIDYYSRAIGLIKKPEAKHWTYYYARGTSYERVKQWPKAEADLQTALRLAPEQPLVLNYLGYSWVDQNRNLKQGVTLIEKAVRLKPDDGYIVDSLGWAHFRQGNFKDAVKWLERAVELRPEDPVLNDHLGDALWRVGREREAKYQWEQSLTLKPEPDDAEKIRSKLDKGLPALSRAAAAKATPKQAQKSEPLKRRTENKIAPSNPFFQ
jgi:tetratricopeptide (TPR) repeat protein